MTTIDFEFQTTDIVFAAYLKTKNYKLINITKQGTCGTFHFVNVPEHVIKDFQLGNTKVEPIGFQHEIHILTKAVRNT